MFNLVCFKTNTLKNISSMKQKVVWGQSRHVFFIFNFHLIQKIN